jgi:hypothetical protein
MGNLESSGQITGMVLDHAPAGHSVVRPPPAALVYWLLSLRKQSATAGTEPATALQRTKEEIMANWERARRNEPLLGIEPLA